MIRLALLAVDVDEISSFLAASSPREQGCFLLLREGRGIDDRRYVAVDPILPPEDAWEIQEPDQLRPSARWISAVISRALEARAGLMFVHAHQDPGHPPALSATDIQAMKALGSAIGPMLDGPFAAAVVHPHGWAAAVFGDDGLLPVDSILAIGRTVRWLAGSMREEPAPVAPLDARQRDALGRAHDILRALTIAVVGVGGLGSPIAEQLVRMGVRRVILVDDDVLDTPSNLRRVFGARAVDMRATESPRKVDVVGRHLDGIGLDTEIVRVFADVRTSAGFRSLLDADVVLNATDTHGSRATVNELAPAYFIPVVDVGVRAGAKANGDLAGLAAEVRVLTPTTPCLWCRKTISADMVRAENLPASERDRLIKEGYLIAGVGEPEASVAALTVLGAGLATSAMLGLLTEEGEACPSAYVVDGLFGDGLELEPTEPIAGCRCRRRIGLADSEPPPLLPGP